MRISRCDNPVKRLVPNLPIWPMALIPLGADPLPSLGWRKSIMASDSEDLLRQLSAALASATASAQSSVVAIRAPRSPPLSGTLWRNNLVVASEQVFPRSEEHTSELQSPMYL